MWHARSKEYVGREEYVGIEGHNGTGLGRNDEYMNVERDGNARHETRDMKARGMAGART